MRILLIGEYSRLHNSLKEGLEALGHNVIIIGNGDDFKKYPVDIFISHSFNNILLSKFRTLIYKLTNLDLGSLEIYFKAKKHIKSLGKFDVIQLINQSSFKIAPKYELRLLKIILNQTEKLFLLCCGVDYYSMKYMMSKKPRYSLMSAYIENKNLYDIYKFQLQYLSNSFKPVHDFLHANCCGVIATDMDYHLPMLEWENYLGLIPNPINTENIKYISPNIKDKIIIFHGVNKTNQHKKGNNYFFEALKIIQNKYTDKVEIKTTYSLPYNEYIRIYDECHILLDQVFGYDQGYNALEAMAKGKVVFTGAEKEWLDYYNLEPDSVAINALPNSNAIAQKLEWLILNPEKIIEISKNARNFIEQKHHYKDITNMYVDTWKKASCINFTHE